MYNLKLYYDDCYLQKSKNNRYILYSTLNDVVININSETMDLVNYIRESKGNIVFEDMKILYREKYNIKINDDEIKNGIKKLLDAKMFFKSEKELQIEKDNHVNDIRNNKENSLKIAYIHTTLKCNFNCSYCYNKDIINQDYCELGTNKWIDILKQLKSKGVINFIFTGGEPLIRKDLKELILSVKDEKTYIEVLTNGSLLKDQFFDLIDLVDKFTISLDSFDVNINAENRSAYNYDDIISALKLFSKYNKNKILVRSVINKNNIKDIEIFAKKLYKEYEIDSTHAWFIPNNYSEIEQVPQFKDIKKYPYVQNRIDFNHVVNKVFCGAANTIISIGPNGDIYPCQSLMINDLKISNILNENWFEDLKNNKTKLQISQFVVDDIKECGNCSYRHICGGGCRAIAYKVYGSLNEYIPYFCEYLKEEAKKTFSNMDI